MGKLPRPSTLNSSVLMDRNHICTPQEEQAALRYQELFNKGDPPTPENHAEMSRILIDTGIAESELREFHIRAAA